MIIFGLTSSSEKFEWERYPLYSFAKVYEDSLLTFKFGDSFISSWGCSLSNNAFILSYNCEHWFLISSFLKFFGSTLVKLILHFSKSDKLLISSISLIKNSIDL